MGELSPTFYPFPSRFRFRFEFVARVRVSLLHSDVSVEREHRKWCLDVIIADRKSNGAAEVETSDVRESIARTCDVIEFL